MSAGYAADLDRRPTTAGKEVSKMDNLMIVAVVDVCECHGEPITFKTDRRRSHGGYEICAVTQRKYIGDVVCLPIRANGTVAEVGGYFTRPAMPNDQGVVPRIDEVLPAYIAIDEHLRGM